MYINREGKFYLTIRLVRHIECVFIDFDSFVATIISGLSKIYGFTDTPNIAMAASVLLLAPGFAFVNSFLDSFKGYMMMGWGIS